jgi:hypothetical protein
MPLRLRVVCVLPLPWARHHPHRPLLLPCLKETTAGSTLAVTGGTGPSTEIASVSAAVTDVTANTAKAAVVAAVVAAALDTVSAVAKVLTTTLVKMDPVACAWEPITSALVEERDVFTLIPERNDGTLLFCLLY